MSELVLDRSWSDADLDVIHGFISRSYWAEGMPRELLARAMQGSMNFLLRDAEGALLAYARVISDGATFAYLCDVFVREDRQGKGLGKQLIDRVMAAPDLQALRRFMLFTRDAHGLYEQYGFKSLATADRGMEIVKPGLYLKAQT